MYEIVFERRAEKELRKLEKNDRGAILAAIEELRDNPRPPGVKKLKNQPGIWRIRCGSFRVLYTIEDRRLCVMVVRIADRKSAYRW